MSSRRERLVKVMAPVRRLAEQPELRPLVAVLSAVGALFAFSLLANLAVGGEVMGFDVWALRAIREHLVRSPGTRVVEVALSITVLGGYPVLTLLVVSVAGFLLLHGLPGRALYVVVAASGGGVLQWLLKGWFARARPAVVEPLVSVSSWSFPSGHAMMSAAVYLSVGSLVAATVSRRRAKLYVLSMAFVLTGLVGLSRVLLGVHYPTDVLAGWMGGLAWALACWAALELTEKPPRPPA